MAINYLDQVNLPVSKYTMYQNPSLLLLQRKTQQQQQGLVRQIGKVNLPSGLGQRSNVSLGCSITWPRYHSSGNRDHTKEFRFILSYDKEIGEMIMYLMRQCNSPSHNAQYPIEPEACNFLCLSTFVNYRGGVISLFCFLCLFKLFLLALYAVLFFKAPLPPCCLGGRCLCQRG